MREGTAFNINRRAAKIRRIRDWENLERFLKKNFRWLGKVTYYEAMAEMDLDGHKNFIMLGGDGTVQFTLQKLASLEERVLGYIPLGTGNDFSLALNIPNKETAAKCINEALRGNENYIKKVDLGKITLFDEGKEKLLYFVGAVGIGIDGDVVKRLEQELKPVKNVASYFRREENKIAQNIGKMIYNLGVLCSLVKYKPRDYLIKTDKDIGWRLYPKVFSLNVSNIRTTGGGIEPCPNAEIDDGYLDICIINGISKLDGINILTKANRGEHLGMKGVEYYDKNAKIKKVEVKILNGKPFDLHMSGEYEWANRVIIEIDQEKKLTVVHNPV